MRPRVRLYDKILEDPLLKVVEGWTDLGSEKVHPAYLRDKQQLKMDAGCFAKPGDPLGVPARTIPSRLL